LKGKTIITLSSRWKGYLLVKNLMLILGTAVWEACSATFSQKRFIGCLLDTTAQQFGVNLGYISLLSVFIQLTG